ncbi:MAG: tetratricopeptide repeat protein [Saprospiraceae bacterium]|nr:tetratricopeptide repeat protein [Saprospiraceae bacterium]
MINSRQLAAILFADIAGYTALMQKDEQEALRKLQHFRQDLETFVPKFGGQIIQFYGDGCLMIFNSVVRAINCCIQLQESLKLEPQVPVRIGVHQGDIIMEGGNIFGNSVNIAARIESMSIPGAVLLSEKVRTELQNQPDIELVSLGHFEFKNVEHAIEVFAIAQEGFPIPQKNEIKGKFKQQNETKSIAVLPFENRSSDPEQEYFSDGITEEIIYGLSQLENLKVASRTSSFVYKHTKESVETIAKQLNVDTILEGSVRKMGNKVRIGVQLVDAHNGFQIWTERYHRELEDIFEIQDEIAEKVVRKLELSLLGKEKNQPIIGRKTDNIKAYQLYLQGRNYLDQRINVDAALSCFKQAVALDPSFAAAYTSIAYGYFYKLTFANYPPNEGFPNVQENAQKALQVDSTIAEAHTMQGLVDFYYKYDKEKARQAYEKSILLQPNVADTYRIKAYFHSMILEFDEAISCAEKAHKLDPMSVNNCMSLGDIYYRADQYNKALTVLEELREKYPDNATIRDMLGSCYLMTGQLEKAKLITEYHTEIPSQVHLYTSNRYLIALKSGDRERASQFLEHMLQLNKSAWVNPSFISFAYFYLGETERATQYFLKAIEERDPGVFYSNVDPLWREFKEGLPIIREKLKEIELNA